MALEIANQLYIADALIAGDLSKVLNQCKDLNPYENEILELVKKEFHRAFPFYWTNADRLNEIPRVAEYILENVDDHTLKSSRLWNVFFASHKTGEIVCNHNFNKYQTIVGSHVVRAS